MRGSPPDQWGTRFALGIRSANGEIPQLVPKKPKKVKSSPRKTPAANPKVGKFEGDWKDVIKKAILKKFRDTRWPEDERNGTG
jgi:hypothetical protein